MSSFQQTIPSTLPVLPLREQIIFPYMSSPLFVSAEEMVVIESARQNEELLVASACFGPEGGCRFASLGKIATVCRVLQVVRFPDGGAKVTVEGLRRISMVSCRQEVPFILARIQLVEETVSHGLVYEALVQSVGSLLKIALSHGRPLPGDAVKMIDKIDDAGRLADLVTVYLNLDLAEQQRLLELLDPLERLKSIYLRLTNEVQSLQVRGEIQSEVARKVGKTQKEYLLREQMKQIREELGDEDPRQAELEDLRRQIETGGFPEGVRKVALKEFNRLERIAPTSPEHTVVRTYLDTLCSLPWGRSTEDNLDIAHAAQVLDEDHYGLKNVKERILEYLAVRSLKADPKGPLLCFVGPPGVGKTSLGRSIARAMGRSFIRLSLGGMRDEAEIRGHRRTYIGALPGRILQELSRAGSDNPVFMLDEIDKIGQDFRGDPAAALLEVLDPAQNDSFRDHYLDVPFDLSRVMFITTANHLDPVPHALKDRLEVIRLAGYSEEEKRRIAFDYLIPRQLAENGLVDRHPFAVTNAALERIIRDYTREAGVRALERQIASLCRKVARMIAQHHDAPMEIDADQAAEQLGPRLYFCDVAAEEDRVGVVTGLAWTESGGDIIFIEAARMSGEKGLILTGSLGEVMQESARIALSLIRQHAAEFGIVDNFFSASDLHIHVPAGAIPKDGPSAGVAMAVALISLLSGRPARRDVAMTGELTLTGRILPVGGIKEKILAARRAGVRTVVLPERNRDHLQDLDASVTRDMRLLPVETLAAAVECALHPLPGVPLATAAPLASPGLHPH